MASVAVWVRLLGWTDGSPRARVALAAPFAVLGV
jgi:hypothetical protein